MPFKKEVLIVNRVSLVMGDELARKWGDSAQKNRRKTQYATAIILGKLQKDVTLALALENPEACLRPELLWVDYGSLSVSGLFVIASSADEEMLNHVEDNDYLIHLHTIKRVANEHGFNMMVTPIQAAWPFKNTTIPLELK